MSLHVDPFNSTERCARSRCLGGTDQHFERFQSGLLPQSLFGMTLFAIFLIIVDFEKYHL